MKTHALPIAVFLALWLAFTIMVSYAHAAEPRIPRLIDLAACRPVNAGRDASGQLFILAECPGGVKVAVPVHCSNDPNPAHACKET